MPGASAGTTGAAPVPGDPTVRTPAVEHLARPARTAPRATAHDPHAVLVKFKRGVAPADRERLVGKRGARLAGAVRASAFVKVRTDGDAAALRRALADDPSVAAAVLDRHRRPAVNPNDPFFAAGDQRYLNTLRLPQAWDRVRSGGPQVIAVVDTGVDLGHPDLTGRLVAGFNAVNPGAPPTDYDPDLVPGGGHGTMVAGIAAANTNNRVGLAGAAWGTAKIMPVKVFGTDGSALDSDIAEGVTWAADHNAKIINLSLGGPGDNPVLHDAIKYATGKGAVVVVAAGNTSDNTELFPAAYPEVLAVGATDNAAALTDFSSWGDWIDVAAPGFDVLSSYARSSGFDYAVGSGTSFSAPLVSGVAALVRTKFPALTPAQVVERLRATSRDAGPRGIDPYYGHGVVDAFHAVGGSSGGELPQRALGANEPNGVPARATAMSGTITGTVAMEGDVDWYTFTESSSRSVEVVVTPPPFVAERGQNADPILEVYDPQLRLLARIDSPDPTAVERFALAVEPGTYYVAVRSFNGAADTRPYTLQVQSGAGAPAVPGDQVWVRDVSPADFETGATFFLKPTVTFQRTLDPASVDSTTVQLRDGRTGAAVAATPSYDAATNSVTLTPTPERLEEFAPFRIVVGAVRDQAGAINVEPFSSTFRVLNVKPPAVTDFAAATGYHSARLTWTPPNILDFNQVIIRSAPGHTPPASPTAGTAVFAGTGTSVTVTGLSGAVYSFAVWVKDKGGLLSPVVTAKLVGTFVSPASATPATVTYPGAVTVKGRLIRRDNAAGVAAAPLQLYVRRKGTTAWKLQTTVTTSATGNAAYTHKPSWSLDYRWQFAGSSPLIGTQTTKSVGVRPAVSAKLSKTSIRLGASVRLTGGVQPAHAGKTVVLQRKVKGVWKTVKSKKLSAGSTYSFTIKPSRRGSYAYRVYRPADSDNLAHTSAARVLRVK